MKINEHANEVIKVLLKEHDKDGSKVTYYTNVDDYAAEDIDPKDAVMLPNVLLWDPLLKFSASLYCPTLSSR